MEDKLDQLLQAVLASPKYRQITPELVTRIGAQELAKGRKLKEAIKATKNKLHQVGAAYHAAPQKHAAWLSELKANIDQPDAFKAACKRIMGNHASTKERLPVLETFYTTILTGLPPIQSVLDVACGLNPLAIPWMPLADSASYYACDIYADMVEFVGDFMALLPVRGKAQVCDVISAPPSQPVDLALILKTIPCLEQVDKQTGAHLLETIQAKMLLVSFPAKSLGGRQKGMVENYTSHFMALTAGKGWQIERFDFPTELAFLVRK